MQNFLFLDSVRVIYAHAVYLPPQIEIHPSQESSRILTKRLKISDDSIH